MILIISKFLSFTFNNKKFKELHQSSTNNNQFKNIKKFWISYNQGDMFMNQLREK